MPCAQPRTTPRFTHSGITRRALGNATKAFASIISCFRRERGIGWSRLPSTRKRAATKDPRITYRYASNWLDHLPVRNRDATREAATGPRVPERLPGLLQRSLQRSPKEKHGRGGAESTPHRVHSAPCPDQFAACRASIVRRDFHQEFVRRQHDNDREGPIGKQH